MLRQHVGIEGHVDVGSAGATVLGCRQGVTHRALSDGRKVTAMEWALERCLESCLEKYTELTALEKWLVSCLEKYKELARSKGI